ILVGALLLVAGCARKESGAATPTAAGALRKVVLQTDWFPQAEHGGYYQAAAKGYYRDAGLEVEILSGGPGAGISTKVAKGEADFGMHRSDNVIMFASRGLPVTIVAATFQRDPQALMVRAESPVKSLADLAGRTVTANVGMTWIPYVQKKYGITFNLVPNNFGLANFWGDPNAIQQCLATNEPFLAQQRGIAVRTLLLAASGHDSCHVIFCRRELVRQSPETIRAFVAASIRGWRDYLEGDPAPAHEIVLKRNPQMSPELLAFSRREMIEHRFVQGDPARGEGIGRVSLARIADEIQTLLDLKILEAPLAAETVATEEFLPAPGR
ncbi:MAG: ABC transporter substrate-binding protein, partial [Opitutaceae bacterium]